MTKREMYDFIATLNADYAEVVDFCKHEIELLDNRKGASRTTKTQKDNAVLKEVIVTTLRDFSEPVTVTELSRTDVLNEYTGQKLSALLSQLVKAGRVNKVIEGRKSLFSVAE